MAHDCTFADGHLAELRVTIAQALTVARAKPVAFEVDGTPEMPGPDGETSMTVDRSALIALLTDLDQLASIAQSERRDLVCEGEDTLARRGILSDAQKRAIREARLGAVTVAERYLAGNVSYIECYGELRDITDAIEDPLIEDLFFPLDQGDIVGVQSAIAKLQRSVSEERWVVK